MQVADAARSGLTLVASSSIASREVAPRLSTGTGFRRLCSQPTVPGGCSSRRSPPARFRSSPYRKYQSQPTNDQPDRRVLNRDAHFFAVPGDRVLHRYRGTDTRRWPGTDLGSPLGDWLSLSIRYRGPPYCRCGRDCVIPRHHRGVSN